MSVLKIMTMAELTTKDVDMKYARIDAKRKLEMQKKKNRSRRSKGHIKISALRSLADICFLQVSLHAMYSVV